MVQAAREGKTGHRQKIKNQNVLEILSSRAGSQKTMKQFIKKKKEKSSEEPRGRTGIKMQM